MTGLRAAARLATRHGTALASVGAAGFLAALMLMPQPSGANERNPGAFLWECHAAGSGSGQLAATLLDSHEGERTIRAPALPDAGRPPRGLAFGTFARE